MDEENNFIPEELDNSETSAPKKRGRKPKAISEDGAPAAPQKRGRKPKSAEEQGEIPFSQSADESAAAPRETSDDYDEDAAYASYSRANRQIEENRRSDEFAFSGDSDYQEDERASGDGDDIPTSFSTDDSDLSHDAYRHGDAEEPSEKSADESEQKDAQNQGQAREHHHNNQNQNQNRQNNNHQQNRHNNQQNQNRQNNQQRNNQNQNRHNNNQQQNRHNNQQQNRQNPSQQNQNRQNNQQRNQQNKNRPQQNKWMKSGDMSAEEMFDPSAYLEMEALKTSEGIATLKTEFVGDEIFDCSQFWGVGRNELQQKLSELGVEFNSYQNVISLFGSLIKHIAQKRGAIRVSGVLDVFEGAQGGAVCFASDAYRLKKYCAYVPQKLIDELGLLRGCEITGLAIPPQGETKAECPLLLTVENVMGMSPEDARALTPFNELVPYYPTRRIIMEAPGETGWDNLSMRVVDLLTPIGLGQRALIVAPPRTGKTVLMQGMAKSIRRNMPDAHLIILMVDERPEEVTDFKRSVDAEIVASTFDQDAFSHVHAAEMVITRARRMVEAGKDVIILLDSITRLARAYNALMPNSGKIMSGGVEANALQKPKRFFGSARNIEGGGSLTIIGTALVETGSKMDEVIFEEFKGTGNLELHLDRSLVDKRIFPAINIEKSGTRKEELLYHPDEMQKIYSLRRAMKGVPSTEAMELMLQRLKKMKTNIEFLMGLNR